LRTHRADELGLQRTAQDFLARLPLLLAEIAAAAAVRAPQCSQRCTAAARVQHAADLVHEVVAGGAVAGPVLRQRLAGREDLFHVHRERARRQATRAAGLVQARAQAAQVGRRIGQAVDMVDAQAIDMPFGHQPQRQGMDRVEHAGQFHPQRHQRGDIEEAPVVDHVVADPPPRQPVGLPLDQLQQARIALPGVRVELGDPARHRVRRQRRQALRPQRKALLVMGQLHLSRVSLQQSQHTIGQRLRQWPVQHWQP